MSGAWRVADFARHSSRFPVNRQRIPQLFRVLHHGLPVYTGVKYRFFGPGPVLTQRLSHEDSRRQA